MKLLFNFPILLCLFLSLTINAQLYKDHDWGDDPKFYELEKQDSILPSVAIKEKYIIQYYMPSILTKNVKLFETRHSIIRVNTKKGIENHNKVYIPIRNVIKVIDIKARVITPDGKIKVLDKSSIKEIKNVKNYGNFKIFAIEGITKKSQLEYIYTLQKDLTSLGSIIAQKDYKINESEVIIRRTSGYKIKVKSYNGFTTLQNEKVVGNKIAFRGVTKNIPAMTEEDSAAPTANRMKVCYFARPRGAFVDDYIHWDNLENNIKYNYIKLNPRKFKSLTTDFNKYIKGKNALTNSEKINLICDYVHHNYYIIRKHNAMYDDLKKVIKDKQTTELGIIKVYSLLFNYYDIPFEIVLTSNRFRHKFDKLFFSNLNLQQALFYFPEEGKFIEPDHVNTYLDYAAYEYISNEGVFISGTSRKFSYINVPSMQYSVTNRQYLVNLDLDFSKAIVKCNHKLTGYRGSNNRGAYKYLKKKDLNIFKNNTAASDIDDVEFSSFSVKNEELKHSTANTPFELEYVYSAESLLDEVGPDLLLNIGKVIGKQNELYQEIKRVNPVELRYPNEYQYSFKIEIPKGYKVLDLNAFKVDKKLEINGQEACKFISDFEIIDNFIIIKVTESYNLLKFDKKHFDSYKDVVNAAFDFSKKSILFEKDKT